MARLTSARRYEGEFFSLVRRRSSEAVRTRQRTQLAHRLHADDRGARLGLRPLPGGPFPAQSTARRAGSGRGVSPTGVARRGGAVRAKGCERSARPEAARHSGTGAGRAIPLQRPVDLARPQSALAPPDDGPALTGTIGEAKSVRHAALREPSLMDVGTVKAATKIQRRLAELRHFSVRRQACGADLARRASLVQGSEPARVRRRLGRGDAERCSAPMPAGPTVRGPLGARRVGLLARAAARGLPAEL